jgi:hypothetical protein
MSETVVTPIGFADSTLESYWRQSDNSVLVRVRAWNGKLLLIRFRDVVALKDLLAGDFSDLVQSGSEADGLLKEALRRNYESIPASHAYVVYSFLDNDEQPALSIVAAHYEIELE